MDANRAFPANFGDFREYWPQSVRILKTTYRKQERRFVGFIITSTDALLRFQRKNEGVSPEGGANDAADARTPPTVLSVGTGVDAVCAQIWKK